MASRSTRISKHQANGSKPNAIPVFQERKNRVVVMPQKSHMQLERILHSQGFGSRKACRILVRQHEITVNGEECDYPFTEFDTKGLQFTVHGEPWQYREKAYLMLH